VSEPNRRNTGMAPHRSSDRLIAALSVVAGMLLGTCVLLGAKLLHPPPVDPMEQEFLAYLGAPVEAFELPRVDGGTFSSDEYRGLAYVLYFTAPGCGACSETYPVLLGVAEEVPTVMISTGDRQDTEAERLGHGFAFPVVLDSLSVVADANHVKGYPTVFVVSRDGLLLKAGRGNVPALRALEFAQQRAE